MSKPGIPQGTRDFAADVVRKRQYIVNTIKNVFELHGFQPLETPAFENIDTLMGKYGEEGDKLLFKILNNGLDNPAKAAEVQAGVDQVRAGRWSRSLTERALRYDLTIPFARYVAMNHGQLTFPYKRYQVQPVWRADRPQRGRYREFWQCDADVVGSRSLLNEADLALIYHEVFTALGLQGYSLRINHRGLLTALAAKAGGDEKLTDITIAIDKLDKIGMDKVREELVSKGLNNADVDLVTAYTGIKGTPQEMLQQVTNLLGEGAASAVADLRQLLELCHAVDDSIHIELDFSLARGLNYYTGTIFEVKAPSQVKMGSIGGGGRYDDLTGLFGVPNIPGVGISFGLDRIYDVLEELQLFPDSVARSTRILFFNMGSAETERALRIISQLRKENIAAEVYHEQVKLDKQFKYAEKKNIPFVALLGADEMATDLVSVKNLETGEQRKLSVEALQDLLTASVV